ncbi:MAG: YebC/PmpR family DNA-binding transcriptional regulator [Firmicutes bacterium]|nr:YebC/PmpR family DNA-binding transcriptional regulator [Bacillota bacterium]
MAGHSKWSNIKRKKAVNDTKREKVFAKILREITVAAKSGANPDLNPKLADAIAKARQNNVPSDNINRILKRARDGSVTENYDQITYEGYGIGGVALIIETLTDNKNRTAANIRHLLDKYGGSLGTKGSVAYMFNGYEPTYTITLDGGQLEKFEKMMDLLDDLDDVQEIYHNLEITEI